MAPEACHATCIKDKRCHRDFFLEALGAADFSLQKCLLWNQREANQKENHSPEALNVGRTRHNL